MTPYFGADGSSMGTVRALPVTSFAQFVKECLGHPALLNVTRDQYHAMSKADRNGTKRVPYFVPASFNASPVGRKIENAACCNLIALDIDDENPAMASVYAHTPAALSEALRPYAYAVYLTASSLPDKPRLRIVVAADAIPVPRYADAVRTVASMLGLTQVTSESLVPVQPMYLPTTFAGDDLLGDHPLLASDSGGALFSQASICEPGAAPTTAKRVDGKTDSDAPSVEDIDFLSAVLPEVTLADMASALDALDPDMSYMEWLDVASGLRHQFPNDTDAAFDLFDKWSAKGKKYSGEKDTAAKWLSLRPTPRGRKPVTARTLLYRASQAGWTQSAAVTERLYTELKAWLEAEDRTPADLMKEAPRRIAGSPLIAPLEKATLVSILQKRLKDHGLKVSPNDLRREMRRFTSLVFSAPEAIKATPDAQLPAWARGMCYVAGANEFFVRVGERRYEPGALNNMFNVHLMVPGAESGRPPMQAQDYLLNVVRIPRVDHYIYDPSHPEQTFFSENGVRYVNTYRPTFPEPRFDGYEEVGAKVVAHLLKLIGNPDYVAEMIDWMAHQVQFPGVKIRWAPLLQGAQGCGKTLIAKIMEAVLGVGNVRFTDADRLFENYNGWACGAQLVALEEVRVVGHNRHAVMNKLKPAIGNDDVMIRDLYEKPYSVKNRTNYLLLTNHHDALALTDDDRRYFVLHSEMQTRAQVQELPKGYFDEMFALVANKAPELRAWLLSQPIREAFAPNGHAPRTGYLREMARAARSPMAACIVEILETFPHPLITRDVVSLKTLKDCLVAEGQRDANGQAVSSILRELTYRHAGRCTLADGGHIFWVRRGTAADAKPELAVQALLDANPALVNTGSKSLKAPLVATPEEN